MTEARLSFFQIQEDRQDFIVTWQAEVEQQVRAYELMRRTQFTNGQFVQVKQALAHGINKPYTLRDDQVYKNSSAEQVDYQLEVIYENGVRQILATRSVNYTPTTARRTWGSIKAMFQ